MSNKECVRSMIGFLQERQEMNCDELLAQFAREYGFEREEAKQVMLELTALQIFCERFGLTI